MSGMKTTLDAPSLSMRDIIAAMPILTEWRNSKGRIMPLHLRAAPGVGKSMLPRLAAQCIAKNHPGEPIGVGVHNPSIMNPADVGGYVLFDDATIMVGGTETRQKVSAYTRPSVFGVAFAIIYAPEDEQADARGFVEIDYADNGEPLYVGSIVRGFALSRGITLLDEFDQGDIDVRKALAPMLDEGRVTAFHLPRDWMVWAASNRAKDASGVGRGLAFLTNRVCNLELASDVDGLTAFFQGQSLLDRDHPIAVSMDPFIDARGRIVRKPSDVDAILHPAFGAYIEQQRDSLFAGVPSDPNTPFLTPRSLEAGMNLFDITIRMPVGLEDGSMNPALSFQDSFISRRGDTTAAEEMPQGDVLQRWRVFQELFGGTVGPENASQFIATLELFNEVPTIQKILANPAQCHLSDQSDARFITAYVVANSMTQKNADALMVYAARLPSMLYQNLVVNACGRDGTLLRAKSFADYFAANPESLLRMFTIRARTKPAN